MKVRLAGWIDRMADEIPVEFFDHNDDDYVVVGVAKRLEKQEFSCVAELTLEKEFLKHVVLFPNHTAQMMWSDDGSHDGVACVVVLPPGDDSRLPEHQVKI